jgi:DNA-binding NarL/FixJ family response regulator
MESVRVLLMDMSPMLRQILRGLVHGHGGVRVVAEYPEMVPLRRVVEEHEADVVLFGHDSGRLPTECRELLEARPHTRLLVVGNDGRRSTLYELRPHREPLGEASPDDLLEAIRSGPWARADAWLATR